jgi:hypothetical protein
MPPHHVALSHVLGLVREREAVSSAYLAEVLHRSGSEISSYRAAMECVRLHARVAIHFHPDRLGTTRVPVAQALLQEGIYRNQFETGLSTGGLSAFPGGARDGWERSLFGGAYHASGVSDSARPKYGALELVRFADGPIPRFGSCYFVMRPTVSSRTSFTFAGSEDPRATERLGTLDRARARHPDRSAGAWARRTGEGRRAAGRRPGLCAYRHRRGSACNRREVRVPFTLAPRVQAVRCRRS